LKKKGKCQFTRFAPILFEWIAIFPLGVVVVPGGDFAFERLGDLKRGFTLLRF